MKLIKVCLALLPLALGAQSSTWITVERHEPLTAGRTADDVKRDALYGAIGEAVRRVVGVRVQGTELIAKAESAGRVTDRYSEVVRLDAEGHATDWTIVREAWKSAPKGGKGAPVTYELVVRVKVERESGTADPGLTVHLDLDAASLVVRGDDAASLVVRGDDPRANDELVARVTSSVDASLTLVLIADDSVFVLAPSSFLDAPLLVASVMTEVPSAELRAAGLRLRASLPPGVLHRREYVAAIVTRRPIPLFAPHGTGAARDTGALTLAEFNRWLVGIPLGERAVAQTVIEVRKTR